MSNVKLFQAMKDEGCNCVGDVEICYPCDEKPFPVNEPYAVGKMSRGQWDPLLGKIEGEQWEPLSFEYASANPFGPWASHEGTAIDERTGEVELHVFRRRRWFFLHRSYWSWVWEYGYYHVLQLVKLCGLFPGIWHWLGWVITKKISLGESWLTRKT